ncbi:hypothetical protein QBC42DRAFT_292208 [Cladorrhinum samala]|uniref:Velvet domain-containing protein n=1 Tax=Cladorrhinum samala TaxID=585594 RepID=A0AAV9H6Y1_9PEZI|nr:hypothetical protein QBC42DRAFT_292208 [Cladorrhinum samala]
MSSSRSSPRQTQSVAVLVQPPENVAVNTIIYPAIVVRAEVRWSPSTMSYLSAMATLYSSSGDIEYALRGNINKSPLEIQEDHAGAGGSGGSGSGIAAYFSFDDLSVASAGTFYINFSVMAWSHDQSACEVVGQANTNYFGVY